MATRFWIRFGEALPIDSEGYLQAPEYWRWHHAPLFTLMELTAEPCVLLLGEPGMGKTRSIEQHVNELRNQVQEPDRVELIQLKSEDLDPALRKFLSVQNEERAAGIQHLFIDSLDEYLWHDKRADVSLARWTTELPVPIRERMRLRIACRTQQFPKSLSNALSKLWPDGITSYELAPLLYADVEKEACQIPNAEAFLRDLKVKRLGALASRPITLKFLIDLAERGSLPSNRTESYERGCRRLCTEPDFNRLHITRLSSNLDPGRRLDFAECIAAVMFFSQKHVIWMGHEPAPTSDAVTIQELVQTVKALADQPIGVNENEMQTLIKDSALFTSIGENRTAFSHQTYPEFLTAKWLSEQPFHDCELLSLLSSEDAPDQVAPPYYEVAAWLASLRQGVLQRLIRQQPKLLLRSDLTAANSQWRQQVCAQLLAQYAEGSLHIFDWDVEIYQTLAHPELPTQLAPYITGHEYNRTVRQVAIHIAHGCRTQELASALLALSLDATENTELRETAVRALVSLGAPEKLVQLRALLNLPFEQDPEDQIRGLVLSALWPHRMLNPTEVLSSLVAPRRPSFGGSYRNFVDNLAQDWPLDALPQALAWVAAQPHGECLTYSFRHLLEAFLRMGLQQIDMPGVRAALAQAVTARLRHCEDPFTSDLLPASEDPFKGLQMSRRKLIAALVESSEIPESIFSQIGLGIGRHSWLHSDDLEWLLESLETSLPERRARWARLLSDHTFLAGSLDDRVYEASCLYPEVQDALPADFKPVVLGSEQARTMQEQHRRGLACMQRRQEKMLAKNAKPALPPIKECIAQALAVSSAGNTPAWPRLEYELSFDENGKRYDDLDSFCGLTADGWTGSDESTQQQIINAAERYLCIESTSGKQFQSDEGARPSDEAYIGFRAFQLLLEAAPARLQYLAPEVLGFWMPVLVNYPWANHWASWPRLLKLAYQRAPAVFMESLIARLDRENASPDVRLRLQFFCECWDQRLVELIANWVSSREVQPSLLHRLFETLLPVQPEVLFSKIRDFIQKQDVALGPQRERAVASGSVLLRSGLAEAWEALATPIKRDPQYGLDVLGYGGWDRDETWPDTLPDEALAELYILLRRRYPDHDDDGTLTLPDAATARYPHRARIVQPEESMARLRDALLSTLLKRPRRSAIDAIHHALVAFPHSEKLARCCEWLAESQQTASLSEELSVKPHTRLVARISKLRTATRAALDKALLTDSDLEAFCIDYFPLVKQQFSDGMTRTQKQNILLAAVEPDELLERLGSFQRINSR